MDQGAAFAGTAGNDTFLADRDINAAGGKGAATLGSLDVLNGGAGTDTLKISSEGEDYEMAAASISAIEKIEVRGSGKVTADVSNSNVTGLETLSVLKAGDDINATAADTTDIAISGLVGEGAIAAKGGKNVTVDSADAGQSITVGDTDAYAVGTINVTAAKQSSTIIVDGGTTVTVNATYGDDSGAIKVGLNKAASGAVTVTQNLNADGTEAGGLTGGNVQVKGGSTITVTSNLTVNAKDESSAAGGTFGNVSVTGDGKTTAVTLTQNYAETEFTKAAVATVKELHTVTFKALANGETTIVDGLTFKATKDLTAAEVAQAFANLTASDTQTSGGKVANGYFTGNLSANFTSGAANGAIVVFTAADNSETLDLDNGDIDPTETVTAGVAGSAKSVSDNSASYGAVNVQDAATASITNVTLNGYGAAILGSANSLDALTTLSLANSHGTVSLYSAATALDLSINNVLNDVSLDAGADAIKTLNITTSGKNSDFALTGAAVETLAVAGDKSVDLTGSSLGSLKTVTVSGSAGLTIDASGANVTAVNTTATTGTVTATVDASKATYTGGAGVDNVTLSSTTVSKAVNTGAGNDKVTLASGTTALTTAIVAGDGTDTLAMVVADAATASQSNAFETKIDGFEKLSLSHAAAAVTVDLSNMDDISYVISAGGLAAATAPSVTTPQQGDGTHTEQAHVVFNALVAGQSQTAGGLTVTASGDATADEVAAVFVSGVSAGNLTVSGALSGWTVSAELPGHAIFDSTTANTNVTDLTASGSAAGSLGLTSMANNGTLELTGAATTTTVTMADATGTADSFNIVTKVNASNLNFGTVAVAGVETINITATDTTPVDADGVATISNTTLALSDSKATTVNVTGESNLSLDLSGALAVTKVDASNFTGKLTLTATGDAGVTVLGGSAADTLTSSGENDVLKGNAGKDVFTVKDLAQVYGGDGADTFNFLVNTNLTKVSTIHDIAAGDVIVLKDVYGSDALVTKFYAEGAQYNANTTTDVAGKVNAALAQTGEGEASWFQHGGNTYIVIDANDASNVAAGAVDTYIAGEDIVIELVGLVDLSKASFNTTGATLEIA